MRISRYETPFQILVQRDIRAKKKPPEGGLCCKALAYRPTVCRWSLMNSAVSMPIAHTPIT